MNRREAVMGSAALAVGALLPGTNMSAEQELSTTDPNYGRVHLTTVSWIDDPDVEQITVKVLLKKGKTIRGSDSYIMERALLNHVGQNLIPWFKYCRDNNMKTL